MPPIPIPDDVSNLLLTRPNFKRSPPKKKFRANRALVAAGYGKPKTQKPKVQYGNLVGLKAQDRFDAKEFYKQPVMYKKQVKVNKEKKRKQRENYKKLMQDVSLVSMMQSSQDKDGLELSRIIAGQEVQQSRSVAEFIELLENDDYFEHLKKSSLDAHHPMKQSYSLSEVLSFEAGSSRHSHSRLKS